MGPGLKQNLRVQQQVPVQELSPISGAFVRMCAPTNFLLPTTISGNRIARTW
jgi:hypothetical protein